MVQNLKKKKNKKQSIDIEVCKLNIFFSQI